jgi:hypothetical protein
MMQLAQPMHVQRVGEVLMVSPYIRAATYLTWQAANFAAFNEYVSFAANDSVAPSFAGELDMRRSMSAHVGSVAREAIALI